jgi:phosphoribosylglycinamide formyltransferase-1
MPFPYEICLMSTDDGPREQYRLGILVSHQGSNFQAIIDACETGYINAKVVVAISNNSQSIGLERARKANIPAFHLSSKTHPEATELDDAILEVLLAHKVNLVVTAGYMKKLGERTLHQYQRQIINVHPSLLPKYGGKGMFGTKVHYAVLDSADTETGITVHYLDGSYDAGEIISQLRLPVKPGDTAESLAARVLPHEHRLLVDTLKKLTGESCKYQTNLS